MISFACADGGLICVPVLLFLGLASLFGWKHHKRHHCCEADHECGESDEEL